MAKDHSDREEGNLLPPHVLLFPISSKGSFICIIPHKITHTTAFITPVVEHWLEREITQWVQPTKDQSIDPSHHEQTLLPQSYISPLKQDMLPTKTTMLPTDKPECETVIKILLVPCSGHIEWMTNMLCFFHHSVKNNNTTKPAERCITHNSCNKRAN